MTLEQLRIFVAVAERQHVTAAARALAMTQSAASAAIAALEERHDVRLFDRVGRRIELTDSGRLFLDEARAVLARAAAAERALDDLGSLRRGRLRLVASQTTAAYWLPPVLAAFHDRHPGVAVEVAIGNTRRAADLVLAGEADFGVVEGVVDDPALVVRPLGRDTLVVVQATPHRGGPVDGAWLRAARWVTREPGSGTRSAFDAALGRLGLAPDDLTVALVLPSNEAVRTAVEAGAGVAALSSLVVGPALAAGTLHRLPLDLGPRPFFGLGHRERYRSRACDALLALIAEREGGG
ncbi:LysR substrate-binding domain-containing protein [Oharaeibacter diazotrophicus]|uniref:DNA-binding transcriptional LysR family regulator n=1 Tax=Oharaeibacter diazotrophicus TaxID=1920512 RepID=A0A4R6RJM0_9HYPH|nr:LysR substrate-binding domain-containing protein [Oharaeibacter diazotrophicus]TDP86670.1 DNA-binding transcriptional LysR family regulator [Oharaeibacter diazotrophicus]BBE71388.1 HTH-type transcriptional regulator CysL [Pleomorphomonas sp. SM30]GLS78145.1 LysR family transcriptional regulator [Oharaeibacter diazotrophicus]